MMLFQLSRINWISWFKMHLQSNAKQRVMFHLVSSIQVHLFGGMAYDTWERGREMASGIWDVGEGEKKASGIWHKIGWEKGQWHKTWVIKEEKRPVVYDLGDRRRKKASGIWLKSWSFTIRWSWVLHQEHPHFGLVGLTPLQG